MSIERTLEVVDRSGNRVILADENGIVDGSGNMFDATKFFVWPLLAASVDTYIFTNYTTNATYRVSAVRTMVSVVGGSGATVTVVYCPRATAIGSGTAQLTAALDLTVTAPSPLNGTLITTPNDIFPGDHLAVDFAGTLTGLVGVITVGIRRTK